MHHLHFELTMQGGAVIEDACGVLVRDVVAALKDCLETTALAADVDGVTVRDQFGALVMSLRLALIREVAARLDAGERFN